MRALPNESGRTRFGCTVQRETAPRAVQRNRLKRWLRESFRLHPGAAPAGLDLVAVVWRIPREVNFQLTEKQFLAVCGRLRSK